MELGDPASLDGKVVRAAAAIFGALSVVLFVPEDLLLPRAAPAARRKYLDLAVFNVERGYYREASAFQKVVKSRNHLLKRGPVDPVLLDAYDDELPYWLKVGARQQLIVPYSVVHNDVRFARQGMTSGDEYLAYVKNAVQCVLEEDPPRMLSFGLHNRIIGHPGRALGLARLLDWLADQPRVWLTRRVDIARHWKQVHPAKLSS